MKKILSLGVAAAVVSMTAVAASAAIEPIILEEAVAGQTITVEVRATDVAVSDVQFNVIASENLELVDTATEGVYNPENGKFAWASMSECEPGALLLTLTYTVGDGEEVSVALEPAIDAYADVVSADAVVATVVTGGEDLDDPDQGGDIIVDDPTEPEEPTDDPTEPEEPTDEPTNPDTGIALAVVPAVLAGAAIVVSKKRK